MRFERVLRTATSEQWLIFTDAVQEDAVARADLHFMDGGVRVSLVVGEVLDSAAVEQLMATLDERLLLGEASTDVRVSVWRGAPIGEFEAE